MVGAYKFGVAIAFLIFLSKTKGEIQNSKAGAGEEICLDKESNIITMSQAIC